MMLITYFLALILAWSSQVSGKTTGKTKTRTTRTTRNFLEPYKLKDFIVKKTTVKGQMQIYYDLNKDSKIDQIETFELKTFESRQFESRQFESRRLTQKKIDRNFDGTFDYTKDMFFGREDGLLDKSTSDTNFDGKIDKIEESYLLDRTKEMNTKKIIVYTKLDKNHDGKMEISFSRLLDWTQHEQQNKDVSCNDSNTLIGDLKSILTKLSTEVDTNASEKEGNFYITDFGFKIHEDCTNTKKWGKSDVIETVRNSLSTGLQCLVELEKKHQQKTNNEPTNNKTANVSGALRNAVAIQSLLENQPIQLVCNEQQLKWRHGSGQWAARASTKEGDTLPEYEEDAVKHPFISLSPHCRGLETDNVSETIFHEIFHNIGHRHGESVEYAYTCNSCCFPNTSQSDETTELACDICAMDEAEVSSKQYVEKFVSWAIGSRVSRYYPGEAIITYMKENPDEKNKRWGALQLAKVSSGASNPVGIELAKILREKLKPLSQQETEILEKALEHQNERRLKPYQPQAKVIAEATYAFHVEGNVDKALKTIEENLDDVTNKVERKNSYIQMENKRFLQTLILYKICGGSDKDNYTEEQIYSACSINRQLRKKKKKGFSLWRIFEN